MKRIRSGINELDSIIGGGFPQGRTCLLSGEAGTGKSIFFFSISFGRIKKWRKVNLCLH